MRTFIAIILLMAAGIAYGQTPPQITVSTEKVKVNGEVMLVHKVKGGETLYSISKAYNVTIDEIVRINESLKAGLKEGSTIYIPSTADRQAAPAKEAKPSAEATAVDAAADSGKAGNASAAEKGSGKRLGERLNISGLLGKKDKGESAMPGEYDMKKYSRKKHTVKWFEKIEDVAGKYKVPVDAIVELNSLETTLIKKKQVLYIPNAAFLELMAQDAAQEESQPAEEAVEEVEEAVEENVAPEIVLDGNVELTYILPLNLRDTLGPNGNFMDFYAGAMLALERYGSQSGNKATVNIVDQMMYSSIEKLVSSGAVYGKKAIIGPVRPADIGKVLEATEGKSIVISPMDQNGERLAAGNPSFYQAPPAAKAQQKSIAELFASKCTPSSNAVLIYETSGADTALVRIAKEALEARGASFSTLSYGILEGREILGKMSGYMKPETDNLVLVLSNSEAFVSDVVRNLNLICTNPVEENRRSITLFGLPRWRNFETIEVDYFHRMNLHLSLPYFVDYNKENVKDFLMKYRALYNSEPTPFSFQGYDVTLHALGIMGGDTAPNPADALQMKGLYTNDAGNGHINTGTKNIMYNNDYTISVIE